MTQTRSFRETLLMINAIQSKEGYLFSEFTFPRQFKLKILNCYLESNRCDLGALDFCHLPSLNWTRTKIQVRNSSRIQYLVLWYLNSQKFTQRSLAKHLLLQNFLKHFCCCSNNRYWFVPYIYMMIWRHMVMPRHNLDNFLAEEGPSGLEFQGPIWSPQRLFLNVTSW